MTAAPISLFSSFIHLDQDGRVHAAQPVFDAERDGWQLMTFHVETDADVHGDHWEIHTEADELVSCLAGGIRLYFRPEQPGAEEEEVRLAARHGDDRSARAMAPHRPGRSQRHHVRHASARQPPAEADRSLTGPHVRGVADRSVRSRPWGWTSRC
ncbi:hypothetical protein R2F25_35895 [Streptomyces sp. UP1A-1]|nr:hypothetical protein [Streptomyces sp. UP1A-1]